jgi:hypothetical protein
MAQPVLVSVVLVALEAAQLDPVLNRRQNQRQNQLQTNLLLSRVVACCRSDHTLNFGVIQSSSREIISCGR